MKIAHW